MESRKIQIFLPVRGKIKKNQNGWKQTNEQIKQIVQKIEADKEDNVDICRRLFTNLSLEGSVLVTITRQKDSLELYKENENFRRFYYRSSEKVYKEFVLCTIGSNINKYHRFRYHEIEKYE